MSYAFPGKEKGSHMSLKIFLTVLLLSIGFAVGYLVSGSSGATSVSVVQDGILNAQVVAVDTVDFSQFWEIWGVLNERYYKQPLAPSDLFYGAIRGMVESTGDPYTTFFTPDEADEFVANLEGTFVGIGAEIGMKNGVLQVVSPLPETPAQRAGLQTGDQILSIDGEETATMSVEEAVSHIRGEKGTTVTLTMRRGETEPYDVVITREKIVIDSVRTKIDDGIMTIAIFTFNGDTVELFNDAVNEALKSDVKGIVLDLRGNPGGLLKSAQSIASAWVGYDTVVIEKEQEDARALSGVSSPRIAHISTVVLVNGGSASASEIVSGALQDYGEATVVGTQTFGKGSVQDYREFQDGSAVKITVAEWFTPKGRTINETGITPDVIVEVTLDDIQHGRDLQKEKAVEILRLQIAEK